MKQPRMHARATRNTHRAGRIQGVLTAIIGAVLFALAYVFGIRDVRGQSFEDRVLGEAKFQYAREGLLASVSVGAVALVLGTLCLIALVRWGIARALVIAIGGAAALVLSQVLKDGLVIRPDLMQIGETANSFPSGHVTVFASLSAAMIWAAPPSFRGFMSVIGFAVLAAGGWQVQAYAWHRPSDVIGAIALTMVCFGLCAALMPAREKDERTRIFPRASRGILLVGMIVAFLTAAVSVVVSLISGANGAALFAGEAGSVGLSAFFCRNQLSLVTVRGA